ncbi:MAG: hypothetical protein CMJ53_02560 [Planctomycetaceae bacterium]|nr:hypothetical protein [Planctomycetaceae bacterium]|tara:strand:- start:172 stop:678 length:507 start_codon:yes stop_codon:yes gene_type:complete
MRLTIKATLKHLTLLSACLILSACGCENTPDETVLISGETFTLEVASTEAAIQRGMGGRKSLARNDGMLFVFPEARSRRFWMKNCLIPLDIMFLDARGRITAIHQMPAEPLQTENETLSEYEDRLPGYRSLLGAQYAIELQYGRISELGLKTGEKIELPFDCLKTRLP